MTTLTKSFALSCTAGLLLLATSLAGAEPRTARGGGADLAKPRDLVVGALAATGECNHQAVSACAKCETVTKTRTVTEPKGNISKTVVVQNHLCGDCKTSVTTVGHGKAKTDVVQHTCKAVDKTASCCAK